MKPFIVGGTFDEAGGKPSSIVAALAQHTGWSVLNGGSLKDIEGFSFKSHDVLLWMPNIDNDVEKTLPRIKAENRELLLISSKRVVEKSYTEFDVVSRMLKTKSNLGIMIDKQDDRYRFRLLDPLGNVYCETAEIVDLAKTLTARVNEIKSMSRINSERIEGEVSAKIDPEFVAVVKSLGDTFSRHVNAINPERFLGNASAKPTDRITRCCHGFPALRHEDDVYLISRRNVDKTTMSAEDFVAVRTDEDKVRYYGDKKPSVDAPIQIRLFNHFNKVNYIVHGHVYAEDAPTTASKVPCGHIEEFDEITAIVKSKDAANFTVNLNGHGCLILAEDLDYIKSVTFKSRPFPER